MTGPSPLLPALRSLEPLGLSPEACQSWATPLSGPQAERLAAPLERAFRGLDAAGADTEYLRSAAFPAHVAQVLRAAEVAESDAKVELLARALAGCVRRPGMPRVDRTQTLRLLEALSDRELHVLAEVFEFLDPLNPFADTLPPSLPLPTLGLSRDEGEAALLGLGQLGLLRRVAEGWQLTPLARSVLTLTGLGGVEHLFL